MIASTISRIIVRVSRWSSTGNAATRPREVPGTVYEPGWVANYRDSAARSKPGNQSGALNRTNTAPQRRPSNHRDLVKSP
jgi:hypothetical protein